MRNESILNHPLFEQLFLVVGSTPMMSRNLRTCDDWIATHKPLMIHGGNRLTERAKTLSVWRRAPSLAAKMLTAFLLKMLLH